MVSVQYVHGVQRAVPGDDGVGVVFGRFHAAADAGGGFRVERHAVDLFFEYRGGVFAVLVHPVRSLYQPRPIVLRSVLFLDCLCLISFEEEEQSGKKPVNQRANESRDNPHQANEFKKQSESNKQRIHSFKQSINRN